LQRRPACVRGQATAQGGVPPIVHDVLRSTGQPLDAETRRFMESRFQHDFSGVRVHTDAHAAESARAVDASAYTVGRDVVFGAGRYASQTSTGQRLLAHELTHVVQQANSDSTGAVNDATQISEPESADERAAERAASMVLRGEGLELGTAGGASVLHRQTDPEHRPAASPRGPQRTTTVPGPPAMQHPLLGNFRLRWPGSSPAPVGLTLRMSSPAELMRNFLAQREPPALPFPRSPGFTNPLSPGQLRPPSMGGSPLPPFRPTLPPPGEPDCF